jgi:LPXTG-motif cell wall-anchored protein
VTSPATGDTSSTTLWVTLMAVSAAAFVGLLAMQKKRSF